MMHNTQRSEPDKLYQARDIIRRGHEVVCSEARALWVLGESLGEDFAKACSLILATPRQLVLTGIGKSGHIGRKLAATFAATGTPAIFIHPSEAAHGDLGMLAPGDVLLVISNSGNTAELQAIQSYARAHKIPVIGMASNRRSHVIRNADVGLILPNLPEACSANIAPTTSTALQLATGDALALVVMDMRGVSRAQLRALHPGGVIGRTLTPVGEVMHGPGAMPLVALDAAMPETLSVMTVGRFGLAGVIDATGRLVGIITDGDLRRQFNILTTATAHMVMTPDPIVIPANMTVNDALARLNANTIMAAFVVAADDKPHQVPLGIIHMHDLLRMELS